MTSPLSPYTSPPCSSLPIFHLHLINVQRSLSFDFGGELVSRCFSFVSRSVQIVYIIASVVQESLEMSSYFLPVLLYSPLRPSPFFSSFEFCGSFVNL